MKQTKLSAPALVFHETAFDVIERDKQPWLRGSQIDGALGYTTVASGVGRLYARHKDEFTSTMTMLIDAGSAGGQQQTRIFSLRGAHLLGMLSKTDRAKEFRVWVLNILETHTVKPLLLAHADQQTIDKDTELSIKQRARVLAESFYPLYCLQMRHAVKSGQIAPAHVASWLPNGNGAPAIGFSGEPNSRWTVCYDEKGIPHVQRMKIGQRLVDHEDYKALHDAITTFRGRCEPPFGKAIN